MAGEGSDSSCTGRTILGGRAGTSGLSRKASERLYVSLHPARMEDRITKPPRLSGERAGDWAIGNSQSGGKTMRATASLRDLGQSLWLDNITRDLLNNGTLKHYIKELSITGVTSNPTIFDHAIKNSSAYDAAILEGAKKGKTGEDLFFELAIADIQNAADLLRDTHAVTNGLDGWVSLEVPPSLAYETEGTIAAAMFL